MLGFGQRPRQHFHIAPGFLLRLSQNSGLILVHFFLRLRKSVGNRLRFHFLFASDFYFFFDAGFVIIAVLFMFQIFQIIANIVAARNIRQSHARFGINGQKHVVIAFDQVFTQDMKLTIDVNEALCRYVRIFFRIRRRAGKFRLPFFYTGFFRRAHSFSTQALDIIPLYRDSP